MKQRLAVGELVVQAAIVGVLWALQTPVPADEPVKGMNRPNVIVILADEKN